MAKSQTDTYADKWGWGPVPEKGSSDWTQEWQDDWDALGDSSKTYLKQPGSRYQGPDSREQFLQQDWYDRLQEGPDTDIWKGLGKALGLPPGAIKKWGLDMLGDLRKGTDFSEEYGVGKQALDQQLREAERGVYKRGAARGLLDSSGTQAQIGGARGGYANALSGLMQWQGQAEEQSRQFNMGALGRFTGQGMDFAQFLNRQYTQDMDFRGQALEYLQGDRWRENQHNLGMAGMQQPYDPTTTGDLVGGGVDLLTSLWPTNWGSGGGEGGGGGFEYESNNYKPPDYSEQGYPGPWDHLQG